MRTRIKLNTISNVMKFVKLVGKTDLNIYIERDNYKIDANSIMGIFSLDILEEMNLYLETRCANDREKAETFLEELNEIGILSE